MGLISKALLLFWIKNLGNIKQINKLDKINIIGHYITLIK